MSYCAMATQNVYNMMIWHEMIIVFCMTLAGFSVGHIVGCHARAGEERK